VADLRTQIESARGAGYSDDEIASFLSQRDPRVQQAIGAGYSAAEVLQFLTTQQPAAPAATPAAPAATEMRVEPEVQAQREAPVAQPAAQPTVQPQPGVPEPMQAAAAMPQPAAQPAAQPQQPQERSIADQLSRQLGLTGRMAAEGVAGGLGLITDPIAAVINQFVPPERRLKTLRSVVSTLLTEGGIAQPETPLERVAQEAGQAVAGAAPQIAAARQIPRLAALATAPGAQLAGAAGAGGGAQTAAEMGAGPGAQIAAGLAGGAAAGIGAGMQRVPGQTAQDIEAARQARIRLMTSDVRPPQTVVGEAAERVREAIPITGTTPVRTAQQRERVESVNRLMQEYGYPTLLDDLPEQITRDLIAKRGADLARLTTARDDVLNRPSPNIIVPVPKTTQAIRSEIAKLSPSTGTPEIDVLINELTELGTRLQQRNLQGLEIERNLLKKKYANPELANVKDMAEKALNRIYSTVVGDMGDFIRANGRPNDYNKWRSSSTELGEMVRELNSASLKAVLRRGDVTPEVVQNALFSNKPSEVKLIVKNLSPQGRDLAKVAVLRRIGERASSLGERGAAEVIDPTKFAQEAKDLGNTIGVVFAPQEAKRIESLVRVLNLTRRAQDVRAPVQLMGTQIPVQVPQFLGAATVGGPVMTYLSNLLGNPFIGGTATLGAGLTIGALGRFYESAPMRNLLDRLATTKPGSAAEAQLVTALSALRVPQPEPQP